MIKIIDETGQSRFLGNLMPPADQPLKYTWQNFTAIDGIQAIPRSEWKEVSLRAFVPEIEDQDGIGSCNAEAACMTMRVIRAMSGLPDIDLSPADLYAKINGGVDQGSLLEDAIKVLMSRGVCSTKLVQRHNWRRPETEAIRLEADQNRILEAFWCRNFDELATAVQLGFAVDLGIMWYGNFKTDSAGWLPTRGSGQAGGHALCGVGLKRHVNGYWGIETPNSWGKSWGNEGFCIIPEQLFGGPVGGYWACRGVTHSGGNTPEPGQ